MVPKSPSEQPNRHHNVFFELLFHVLRQVQNSKIKYLFLIFLYPFWRFFAIPMEEHSPSFAKAPIHFLSLEIRHEDIFSHRYGSIF